VREPDLLLLDEPFSALDALTRIEMHRLVTSLWERYRPGVLLVTHDVDEALTLADRVLVLDEGRVAREWSITLSRSERAADHPRLRSARTEILDALGVDTTDTTRSGAA
jgi:sulfonate transport system ATP-binding protein